MTYREKKKKEKRVGKINLGETKNQAKYEKEIVH